MLSNSPEYIFISYPGNEYLSGNHSRSRYKSQDLFWGTGQPAQCSNQILSAHENIKSPLNEYLLDIPKSIL